MGFLPGAAAVRCGPLARLAVLLMAVAVVLPACRREDEPMLRELVALESPEYGAEEVSDQRIRELRQAISELEETVARKVEATEKIGEYHRILAVEYIGRSMYGPALDHLREAIRLEPENPVLAYWAAVAAGRLAKAMMEPPERERYFEYAERSYLRALELNPRYISAMYGLAVLYVFELERPQEAEPLLHEVLRRQSRNVQAMAVLAHAYAASGKLEEAAEMYGRIAETTSDENLRREAIRNRDEVREALR